MDEFEKNLPPHWLGDPTYKIQGINIDSVSRKEFEEIISSLTNIVDELAKTTTEMSKRLEKVIDILEGHELLERKKK